MSIKPSYELSRKYRKEWEKIFPWIKKSSDGTESAFCTLCHVTLGAHKGTIEQHQKTKSHISRDINLNTAQKQISFQKLSKPETSTKEADIHLSLNICCHTAISNVDHLGEIISLYGKGSTLENLHLHRTKCSQIIKNVLSASLEEEIVNDLEGKKFSVLIDESTDVSSDKHLCVCIRHFSLQEKKIIDEYLGIIPVISTTGEDLFVALKEKLESKNLDLKNIVGYGSDGASNVIGAHNSVWSRIKNASNNCVLMRCICHSLDLVVQNAFELMPSSVGFLLADIPTFFSKSALRREEFLNLFKVMDPNEERRGTPTPFQKFSTTRWLVRGKVLYKLLVNWQELKAYFNCAEQHAPVNIRWKVRSISNMLNDDTVFIYVTFVTPIVQEFERLNALFQSSYVDPEKLVNELYLHHKSLHQRVYDSRGFKLPLSCLDLGAKVQAECSKFIQRHTPEMRENAKKIVEDIQTRCLNFLLELLQQIEKRLPESKAVFKGLSFLTPSKVLSQVDKVPFAQLPLQHLFGDKEQEIEDQYRKVNYVAWSETELFQKTEVPKSPIEFWSKVRDYKNAEEQFAFRDLADYCLACHTLPISNACVERVFSRVTFVKNKHRNRLSTKMLDSILRIKSYLSNRNICCKDFKISQKMIEKCTKDMYKDTASDGEEDLFEVLRELE